MPSRSVSAAASPVEALLRGLLAANGRGETEDIIVEGVRRLLDARWTGLFDEEPDGGFLCRRSSGDGPQPGERTADPADASMALPLVLAERRVVLMVGPRAEGDRPRPRAQPLLARILPDLVVALDKADAIERLWAQAYLDALTGSFNRRAFDEHLHVELLRGQRYGRPTALMLADLDGFKGINDQWGHQAGDHVLRRFAGVLTSTLRNTDVVSRFGGDEFAVIFPETTGADVVHLAERVQATLGHTFPDEMILHPVTASFGIASIPEHAGGAEELLAAADRALYAAKSNGRNRLMSA